MAWDWLFWWAGKRWGPRAVQLFIGNHPKAAKRTARLERFTERFGWLGVVLAYIQPIPQALIYVAAQLLPSSVAASVMALAPLGPDHQPLIVAARSGADAEP